MYKEEVKSEVDILAQQISDSNDVSEIKELLAKMQDLESMNGPNLSDSKLKKWVKKLEPFSGSDYTRQDLVNISYMLDNQYRYITEYNSDNIDNTAESIQKEIDCIKEQLSNTTDTDVRKALEGVIEQKTASIPVPYYNTYPWRAVNVLDEVVKFYDCLKLKHVVGVQPSTGPIGLSYVLRFREDKKIVDLNSSITETTEDKTPIYSLTIEQKEFVNNTREVEYSEKVSGIELAEFVDKTVLGHILDICSFRDSSFNTFVEDVNTQSEEMALKIRVGPANHIISRYPIGEDVMSTFEHIEHNIVLPYMEDNLYIISHGSKTQHNKQGIMLHPYIPFMNSPSSNKTMTRFGMMSEIKDSSLYYKAIRVK